MAANDTRTHWLAAPTCFTGDGFLDDHAVGIADGCVTAVVPRAAVPPGASLERLAPGTVLAPGFVDLQVNGGGGVLFNATPTADGARAIALAHRRLGTTAILPTAITDRFETLLAAAEGASAAARDPASGVVGVHLEGPFLSPARPGAHPPRWLRRPDHASVRALCAIPGWFDGASSNERRVLLTVAPEIVDDETIRALRAAGVVLSAGHSAASFERARAGFAAGIGAVTHLFNAMPPIANRDPGLAAAALADPDAVCGIIADAIHVHPALVRLAHATRRPGTLVLVSDSMPPTGSTIDRFELGGRTVHRIGGRLALDDGTLAGADLDLAGAVRTIVGSIGVPLGDALRMASLDPARLLGLDDRHGRIRPGARADLVLLDERLGVQGVWFGGASVPEVG